MKYKVELANRAQVLEEILDKKADLTNREEQFTQAQEDFKKTVYNYNQKMEYETFKIQQE